MSRLREGVKMAVGFVDSGQEGPPSLTSKRWLRSGMTRAGNFEEVGRM